MKRTAILKRSTGLKSGGILKRSGKGMKSSRPKSTPIRASARDQECTLRFDCCNGRTDTTIWAHSNRAVDGKGMGIKARDEEGCYSCHACHSWLDGGYAGHMPREVVDAAFDRARAESQEILRQKGLMKQKQQNDEAQGMAVPSASDITT